MKIKFIKDYFFSKTSERPSFEKGRTCNANFSFADKMINGGYAVRIKPTPTELIESLRSPIRPQKTINSPNLTSSEVRRELENKQLVNDLRNYFSDKKMAVKDIAELYLIIYNYAIKAKDNQMTIQLSREIRTLLNIIEFYDKQQREDKR